MIEIERKFLLKSMPDINESEKIEINQWYMKNDSGIWERIRSSLSTKKGVYFEHTIKTNISKGVNIEEEKELTQEEFNNLLKNFKKPQCRYLSKNRFIFTNGELKWEVDFFKNGNHLIIAEIEIPDENYNLIIPDFIKEKILLEVTGIKQFSSRSLANKLN